MAQLTFGAILAEAREHQGLDVASAARSLRIRPDILRAIEAEDFSRMPPRGYTRNMVNAYARLVGLNPSEITRMYLDAAYAFQVGKARSDSLPSVSSGSHRRQRQSSDRSRQTAQQDNRPLSQNALGRNLYDDRRTFRNSDYGTTPLQQSGRSRMGDRTHPSRHSAMPGSQYTNFYAGPQGNGAMQSRLPFVIAGVIILVLLIVILVLIFGPKGSSNQEDLSTVPITGLNDTTQSGDDASDEGGEDAAALTAPTSVQVEYRVSSSEAAYVEISVDGGDAQPAYLDAGTVETVDVTGTWSISTWTTDLVSVTVDGEAVQFTQDGSNMPTCTVDFESYLNQWLQDHPGASAPASSSGTGTGTASGSSSGTSGSSSAGSSSGSASGSTTTGATGSSGTQSGSNSSTSTQ